MIGDYDKSLLNFLATSSIDDIKFGKDDAGIGYLKHVFKIHKKELGQTCTNCPGKLDGYIRNVQAFLKQNLNMKNSKKTKEAAYKLKLGVLVRHKGKNVTAHNLTDELAKEILAVNENRSVLFVKMPKNWKKELQVEETAETENQDTSNSVKSNEPEITEDETSEDETDSESLSFEERKDELNKMHYSKIEELVEALGHDYSLLKKDKSIDLILASEYKEEVSEQPK